MPPHCNSIRRTALALLLTILAPLVQGEVVARWTFDGDLEDSAPAGTTADHLSGTALRPPLSVDYVEGVVGQAVLIGEAAGEATALSAPDSDDLDLNSEFTIEAYVYRTVEHGQDWERFATKWFGGSNDWHWAFRGPPQRSQDLFMNGAQQINQGEVSADVPLNEWTHVAITGDPTNGLRLWQNGQVVGSSSYVAPKNGTDSFRLGNATPGSSQLQFSGRVDDFQIHNVSQDATYFAGRTALLTGAPAITSFTADPESVPQGDDSTLRWIVSDADSITLHGGGFDQVDVTGQDLALATNLTASTTFTLTATNENGSASAEVTIAVHVPGAGLRINEFLAINNGGRLDEDGDDEDWIEIHNPSTVTQSIGGWHLTDDPDDLTKWQFPSTTIPRGGYLLVFASNKDRTEGELHTNFRLSGDGEYLALVEPDGETIVTEFAPSYPPQQSNVSYGLGGDPLTPQAFFPPTPRGRNNLPTGPIVRDLTENPMPVPGNNDPIEITAHVSPSSSPVSTVTLQYRVMYGTVVSSPMEALGDGWYRGVIPASASAPRQMVRWRVTARDQAGRTGRAPRYHDPRNSPEYHGTVIADPTNQTRLPVMHRFVQNASGTETRSGTRGSFFYNGEFYDNIFTRIRGGTSQNWPKKSYKIEFNDGHHFRFREGVPRVDEINLNTTYTDKSYLRAVLAYEHQRDAGMPSPEAFLVQLRQNGSFWNVAILVEQPDRDYLRRWNLDPDGSLYKGAFAPTHYTPSTPLSRWEKKTRLHEGKQDLDALLDGLNQTGRPLETFLFDEVNLPMQVNYMATTCISQNIDGSDKNHYLYRDTNGSGEWTMLPWDLDLTFGPDALNTDRIVFNQNGTSHPYIGARPHLLGGGGGKYNHFLETIVANQRTRTMLNRRIRTLIDEHLRSGYFHDRIDELVAIIDPDVRRDKARWRGNTHFSGSTYSLTQAAERIKREYLDPRIPYLTEVHGERGSGNALLPAGSPVRALVPRDGSLGDTWKLAEFDDSSWLSGAGGVGYERSPSQTYTPLLGIDLLSEDIPASQRIDSDSDRRNDTNSCFIRYRFDLADNNAISTLLLRVMYDDGFVAFLNGTQVEAQNEPIGPLTWQSEALLQNSDPRAQVFQSFNITAFKNALVEGPNILAIHALNFDSTSSDMLLSCELIDSIPSSGTGAGIPSSQPLLPPLLFGDIEFNPASGNQDEEFIEIVNPNTFAVDLSGWRLQGGVDYEFTGGTVLPPRDRIFLSPNVAAFRNRGTSPKGGERRFVQGNYSGHLSNFGEPLKLLNKNGDVVLRTLTPSEPSPPQEHLVVSEIMYHPADPHAGAEFIELLNISEDVTLDLTGVRFTRGIRFDFGAGDITSLGPGARLLVVRDRAAFETVHGLNHPIAGVFAEDSALDNDGDVLKLEDATNSTIAEFRYNDALPWPPSADGQGPSLVLIAPFSRPVHNDAFNWRPSISPNGNPNASDAITFQGIAGADEDRNGLDDLLDYALGHRSGHTNGLPKISFPEGALTVAYQRNLAADDIRIIPEWSRDLTTWQPLNGFFLQRTPTETGGRQTITYEALPTFSIGEEMFLRVRVEQRSGD